MNLTGIDLRNFDPVANQETAAGQQILAAGLKVISTVGQLSGALSGNLDLGESATSNAVFAELASRLTIFTEADQTESNTLFSNLLTAAGNRLATAPDLSTLISNINSIAVTIRDANPHYS